MTNEETLREFVEKLSKWCNSREISQRHPNAKKPKTYIMGNIYTAFALLEYATFLLEQVEKENAETPAAQAIGGLIKGPE